MCASAKSIRKLLAGLALVLAGSVHADESPIVLFSWSDYVDPAVIEDFTATTGIEVQELNYASDWDRDAQIAHSVGGEFDVIVVNGPQLDILKRMGWLSPIDETAVPNLRHIDTRWREAYPAAIGHAVPYFWGSVGIAYRADHFDAPIDSWMQMFRPAPALCGRLPLPPDNRQAIDLALIALGISIIEPSRDDLQAAKSLLLEQKKCIGDDVDSDMSENSDLVSGATSAAILYNGDALVLSGYDENIRFNIPSEGTLLWVDYMVVPTSSKQKAKARALIDFLNIPEIAARQADYLHYATPNMRSRELLPDSYRNNSTIFPSDADLKRSVFEPTLPPRTRRQYNTITAEVFGSD